MRRKAKSIESRLASDEFGDNSWLAARNVGRFLVRFWEQRNNFWHYNDYVPSSMWLVAHDYFFALVLRYQVYNYR